MSKYYKFLPDASALPSILAGHLKFTPPSELNDPTELMPHFSINEVRRSLAELRERGHRLDELQALHRQAALLRRLSITSVATDAPSTVEAANTALHSPAYDNMAQLEWLLGHVSSQIAAKVGICCLTQRKDSLPMWVHYGNRARGILVELVDLETHFPGDETGALSQITRVNYEHDIAGITFFPESYRNIFFNKFNDWAYENEYRVVLALDDCQARQVNGTNVFTKELHHSAVRSVIIGWRASAETKDAVRKMGEQARTNGWKGNILGSDFERGQVKVRND